MVDLGDSRQPEVVPPVYREPVDLTRGKNIVVCADGTGNADVKGRGSNVFKLFEAIDTTRHLTNLDVPRQIAFYDEGVGTENWWPRRVVGGAFGLGLGKNVRELYHEIARVYQPGDRLYCFGFSRGAFTVRTLAAFIDACGILDASRYATNEELSGAVMRCWRVYKKRALEPEATMPPDLHCHACRTIEFVGAWDTVDAVGLPDYLMRPIARVVPPLPFKFDVTTLPSSVRFACHALALDEPRKAFSPVLWRAADNVEQVWFAGAHSDVGGGYPRHGLSLVPLHWMMRRAEARGLRFSQQDSQYYNAHQIIADRLHDPRSGFAMYYRWEPRDVEHLCTAARVDQQFHISIFDRIAQGVDGYAPINIAARAPVIVFTEHSDWKYVAPNALRNALIGGAPVLESLRGASRRLLRLGDASYLLFVAASACGVLGTLSVGLRMLGVAGAGYVGGGLLGIGAALAISAWSLAKVTDGRLDALFSRQWHALRKELLAALARTPTAGASGIVKGVSSPPA